MDTGGLREPAGFVVAGVILKAHGLRGEIKVRPFTQSSDSLTRYRRLYLGGKEAGALTLHTCELCRVSGPMVILRLSGYTDRDMAEQLVGQQVWLAVDDLPPAGEGEYYLHTLVGKQAVGTDGHRLGMVTSIIGTGGQDILVIRDGDNEVLVPVVRAFIREIGEEQVVLDLPPGLLEING